MKFPYAVKYNGVIYPANAEIAEPKPTKKEENAVKAEKPTKSKSSVKGDK